MKSTNVNSQLTATQANTYKIRPELVKRHVSTFAKYGSQFQNAVALS